jgi:hypothetical protein
MPTAVQKECFFLPSLIKAKSHLDVHGNGNGLAILALHFAGRLLDFPQSGQSGRKALRGAEDKMINTPTPAEPATSTYCLWTFIPGPSYLISRSIACLLLMFTASWPLHTQEVALSSGHYHRVVAGPGELEVAVSGDGKNVVIAVNGAVALDIPPARSRLFRSGNGGADPFVDVIEPNIPHSMRNSRDPSVTWTGAGKFYFATMGPATNARVASSSDQGATFHLTSTSTAPDHIVALCVGGKCSSDQPHIAGDRRPGQDQLYIVWRNSGSGQFFSRIGCSTDGGVTWIAQTVEANLPVASRKGDYPRLTVGPDGFVYVIMATSRTDGDLLLQRYSPCSAGLKPFWKTTNGVSAPSHIGHFQGVRCVEGNTIAGLDRCNTGNIMASPTVAVAQENPKHVFVTFADESSPGNHDVILLSVDDITSLPRNSPFPHHALVNEVDSGERYFPWSCAAAGRIYAGWYDRRSKTPAHNDNTEYFVADNLAHEVQVSHAVDPQCDSGWPSGGNPREAEACSKQPQFAGFCLHCTAGSQVGNGCTATPHPTTPRCDYSSGACPSGTACVHPASNRGTGRYGDYVGIACANQSAFVAWASSRHPSDLPDIAGLAVYFARIDPVLRPPESTACKECRDERNSCQQDAHHTNEIHACVQEYNHCRHINNCH